MVLSRFGVDRAIGFTILHRAWGLLAGPATLIFVIAFLTPAEQGFYYAFAGVLGLQIFFELGLGFVVMQTVSHLMADLRVEGNVLLGAQASAGRLGRLLADVLRWYGLACAAFIGVILLSGFWFFTQSPGNEQVHWQLPWLLVVPVFGFSILANACFSFLEGMGLVADVAFARLVQSVIGLVALCLLFALGAKLMALVALHAVNLIVSTSWIVWRRGRLLRQVWSQRAPAGAIGWRQEIWPFQWRIAVSWMAGYCGTQVITLILFSRLGPVEAGRFGLTLTALSAVATGATAWVSTKAPRFGSLVAQGRTEELNALFAQAWRGALVFGAAGLLMVLLMVSGLSAADATLGQRFVPLLGLVAMACATLVSIKVSAEATYLRAFRREPYLTLSIVNGAVQAAAATLLVATGSLLAVTLAYAGVSAAVGLAWAHPLFMRLREDYRAETPR